MERTDAKEVRLFEMFSAVIARYQKLFTLAQKNVDQIRRKQMLLALIFLSLTVSVSVVGFFWFITQVQTKQLGIGSLLLYISVIAYLVEGMACLVEDASLLYDSLLWVKKYQHFLDFKKIFDAQPYQVGRLLITETARVQGDVQLDSYKRGGIEWYDISFESSACRICRRAASGGLYRHDRAIVGYNMYPFHPNCLCSIMPAEERNSSVKTDNILKKLLFGGKDKEDSDNNELMLSKKYIDDLMKDIDLKTAPPDDIIKLGKAFNYRYDVAGNIGNKEKLKELFANHREMSGVVPNNRWAKGSNKVIRKQLEEAFSYYPKDWADTLNGSGRQMLARKHPKRGFFSEGAAKASGREYDVKYDNYLDGYLTIVSTGVRKTTPYHEIGHMVEFFNKNLVRIEKEWVDQRTKDEKPTRLLDIFPNLPYGPYEVVKKDNFVDPYIGKYYDDAAEVFIMGIQGLFESSEPYRKKWDIKNHKYTEKSIVDDSEYLNLIIGLSLKG